MTSEILLRWVNTSLWYFWTCLLMATLLREWYSRYLILSSLLVNCVKKNLLIIIGFVASSIRWFFHRKIFLVPFFFSLILTKKVSGADWFLPLCSFSLMLLQRLLKIFVHFVQVVFQSCIWNRTWHGLISYFFFVEKIVKRILCVMALS